MIAATDGLVIVVDDDLSVREGLDALLRAAGMRCALYDSAAAFLAAPRPPEPACLVLDVHLPESSGLEVAAELRRRGEALPVIFITGRATIPMSVRAMKLGAVEFLPKPFGEEELLRAIHQALGMDRAARATRERLERLTARERQVLTLVVQGLLSKEIAHELGTALQTIKQHRSRIMQKLGARSVADLVRLVRVAPPD